MTEKTNIDDIIGIVKTEEKTDSVELKKEYYKNQSKDKHYTYLNYSRDGHIGSFYLNDKPITNKEVWDLLNEQEETINELKQRNQRQYDRLKELTELMYERQWEKLENMVNEWEKADELLEQEHGNCGDKE